MSTAKDPIGVGVIGCGYWGPNIIRNFHQVNEAELLRVVDLDEKKLARIQELYPSVETSKSYEDILKDDRIGAVAIVTPVDSHAKLAIAAFEAGKHVFVEKPMAASVAESKAMIAAAEERNLKLMVGHVFEYTEAVRSLKRLLGEGTVGDLYYVNSQRLNLGLFRNDVNVIWDLAPHDFSIMSHLVDGKRPKSVQAIGAAHINPKVEDVATVTLEYENNLVAFVQVSWLDPKKVRQTVLVGSERMIVYDDIEPTEKIWIYDRSVSGPEQIDDFSQFPYTYRYGDITIPRISGGEPLRAEVQHFLECIREDKTPLSDGYSGLRVVEILEATNHSLAEGGRRIDLAD